MRCPRERTVMTLDKGAHVCPDCGWTVRLHDAAFTIPTDEAGWTQGHGEPLVLLEGPTLREQAQKSRRLSDPRPCADCLDPYQPKSPTQKRCTPCAVLERRKRKVAA